MNGEELRQKADGIRDADPEQAALLYAQASDLGDVPSSLSLGSMLLIGKEIPKDWEKARVYTQRAADAGDSTGICNLGVLFTDTDCARALELFEKAAGMGNVSAVRNAAVLLRTGGGVPMDPERAAIWLEKGVEMGDPSCGAVLAHMLRVGEGVPEDKPRAAELYRRAAEAGDRDSMYDLAMMLDAGDGIPEDREGSEEWFRRAADLGDDDACLCIGGILYERGDYAGAASYFTDAAMDGDVKAMYNLALMYTGSELNDPAKGREWLEAAADKGFAYAQTMLGSMLLDEGRPGDAEAWLRKAADQNEPTAMYNLGAVALAGRIGMGTEEAVGYLVKAAEAGVQEATQLLSKLSSSGLVRSADQEFGQRSHLERAGDAVATGAVVAVDDGAVHSERLGGAGVVEAVAHVHRLLLRHIEERERERYRVRIRLVAFGLVPSDDDLRDVADPVGVEVAHDLLPAGAGYDAYALPAGLQLPEHLHRLGERDRGIPEGCEDPLGELGYLGRLLRGRSPVDIVQAHVDVFRQSRRIVGLALRGQHGLEDGHDPGPGIEQRVVEIEQVQRIVSHLHPSSSSSREPMV